MALPSGATFAGYSVARKLGSGLTGEVYLVQDLSSARWEALKILSPALSTDDEFRRNFRAQSPIAANLHHRHIVDVYERGEFGGQLYVAMEYIEGTNAARLMADRFPAVASAPEVLAMVTAIAGALDYAHHRGMAHGDVKPANIMLRGWGEGEQRILLADFGIAPPIGATAGSGATDARTRARYGTLAYMAPEQLSGADFDGRADQYALAASAFHLLTGAPPARHSGPAVALRQHLIGAPPRLSDQRPELAHLDAVFAKALAQRPADRFGTCREFAEAANEQAGISLGDRNDDAGDVPAAGPAPVTEEPTALPLRRRTRTIVRRSAAAVLMVAMLALGVVIGRKTDSAPGQAAAHVPVPSVAAGAPTTTASGPPPIALDGSYGITVERTKQTYNYVSDPQPPDVKTWWAFRSSCAADECTAAATQLDDNDHLRAMSPGGGSLFLHFREGHWQAEPVDIKFPCVGTDGLEATQSTTLVLSLEPQANGEFVGEETVTVQSDECGQRSAVIRIPAVASRNGDVPPAVSVPDPENHR